MDIRRVTREPGVGSTSWRTLFPEDEFRCTQNPVALDGSELGEQILAHLPALVNQETEVHLLRVVTTHLFHPKNQESVKEHLIHEAKVYLEHIEERLRRKGLDVLSYVEFGSEAAETTLVFAKKGAFDLLAITTHGLSGLGRWVLGSVAEKVIRVSSLPVHVVRAKKP